MNAYAITPFTHIAVVPTTNPYTKQRNGDWYMTLVTLEYMINGMLYEINPGYVTDFGSIPKLARAMIPHSDESLLGFIWHDFLYGSDCELAFTRKEADDMLYRISVNSRQAKLRAKTTRFFVRSFGAKYFRKNKNVFREVDAYLIAKIIVDNGFGDI